jgi:orotate phosphoribosyltransferase
LQRSESIMLIERQGTTNAACLALFDRFSQSQASLERTSLRAYKELLQIAAARHGCQEACDRLRSMMRAHLLEAK